jgi:hypothetical protein
MARIYLLTVAVVGLLTCTATAKAPAPPPAISELVGVWDFTFSGSGMEIDAGRSVKGKVGGTWTVTQEGPAVIRIQSQSEGDYREFLARYSNGIICLSDGDDTQPLPTKAATGVIQVTGAAPKFQMRGRIVMYELDPGDSEVQSGSVQAKKR